MRIPFPTSRDVSGFRLGLFDIVWASVSPLAALYFSNAYVLSWSNNDGQIVALYCLISLLCSVVAFLFFRIQEGMSRHFSVHDALSVCKAVVCAELLACVALFNLTRLEGIPRSAPIIHALILATGLITARALIRLLSRESPTVNNGNVAAEYIVMIGSTRLSALYIKFLKLCARNQRRVAAVLDGSPGMVGRAIEGVRIVGGPQQLDPIIDEYALHGIKIDRVIVGGEPDLLPEEEMKEICRICEARQIGLDFVPQLVGLNELKPKSDGFVLAEDYVAPFALPSYFRLKQIIDFCAALTLIIVLLPLFIGVSAVVLLDVGSPVLFWQQRIGARGQRFLLYKFRTMRSPFDWHGNVVPSHQRLTRIGHLLRETSLDELPQLLNVLVGDMSLIGPRPLLPEDQPANTAVRLLVRPGITGWAQINGRKDLTAGEKEKLDEWYIRNASMRLDLQIIVKTLQIVGASARPSSVSESGSDGQQSGDIRTSGRLQVVKSMEFQRKRHLDARGSDIGNNDNAEPTKAISLS